ncbi:hypothetical protein OAB00_00505 [Akkermansiaceae bacterium]|nr:hypothetical protein [Akkermansiaceae bacterium]
MKTETRNSELRTQNSELRIQNAEALKSQRTNKVFADYSKTVR